MKGFIIIVMSVIQQFQVKKNVVRVPSFKYQKDHENNMLKFYLFYFILKTGAIQVCGLSITKGLLLCYTILV